MPIGHVSIPVASLEDSTAFYLKALQPLGYSVFAKFPQAVGLNGKYDGPDFWLHLCPEEGKEGVSKTHVAFKGKSKKIVDAFWKAAMAAGAEDNGKPGERHYTKGYYAAYVLDPEGNNIECVYYQPWWLTALQFAPNVVGAVVIAGVAYWGGKSGWSL